jgi:hypothetical protein
MDEVKALIKFYDKKGWCWLKAVAFLASREAEKLTKNQLRRKYVVRTPCQYN